MKAITESLANFESELAEALRPDDPLEAVAKVKYFLEATQVWIDVSKSIDSGAVWDLFETKHELWLGEFYIEASKVITPAEMQHLVIYLDLHRVQSIVKYAKSLPEYRRNNYLAKPTMAILASRNKRARDAMLQVDPSIVAFTLFFLADSDHITFEAFRYFAIGEGTKGLDDFLWAVPIIEKTPAASIASRRKHLKAAEILCKALVKQTTESIAWARKLNAKFSDPSWDLDGKVIAQVCNWREAELMRGSA